MELNLPNQITIARLAVSLAIFVLLPLRLYTAALVCFVVAAGTDWLDGYLARKYQLVTQLGRILDPFADKILVCGTFIFLAAEPESSITAWMAVLVVGREMLVTGLRSFLEQQGADFSAKTAGKLKMVFQCLAVVLSLQMLRMLKAGETPPTWLKPATQAAVLQAILTTVYSGAEYVQTASRLLRGKPAA